MPVHPLRLFGQILFVWRTAELDPNSLCPPEGSAVYCFSQAFLDELMTLPTGEDGHAVENSYAVAAALPGHTNRSVLPDKIEFGLRITL